MNQQGQTSIEYLFVSMVALTIIIITISGFAQVNNSTLAIGLIKSHTLKEISMENQAIRVEEIVGPVQAVNGQTYFTVKLNNGTVTPELVQRIRTIESTLREKAGYANAVVSVEEG